MDMDKQRRERFLRAICEGKRFPTTVADAETFTAAVKEQKDPVKCFVELLTSRHGKLAARKALLIDDSALSLNGHCARLLLFLTNSAFEDLAKGKLLRDLLQSVLSPTLLWDAYREAAARLELNEEGMYAFARLICTLMMLLPATSELETSLALNDTARNFLASEQLQKSASAPVRKLAFEMEHCLQSRHITLEDSSNEGPRPGGRHDNDFADFREISIYPTRDELLSTEEPYLLTMDSVLSSDKASRPLTHRGNQFRLLRQDMLSELKEGIKQSNTSSFRRPALRLRQLQLSGMKCGDLPKLRPVSLHFRCFSGFFKSWPDSEQARKQRLSADKSLLKHGLFGCILVSGEIVTFAVFERDIELLSKSPPEILLRPVRTITADLLTTLKLSSPQDVTFLAIDSPTFAYEPILRELQVMKPTPMLDELLAESTNDQRPDKLHGLEDLAERIREMEGQNISGIVDVGSRPICLDHAQTNSLISGLTERVCQIQGPPGTGKSFTGALLAKILFDQVPDTTLMVLCYTNHALDQFLEDLLDIGVDPDLMLRLGSKHTARTASMALHNQSTKLGRESRAEYTARKHYEGQAIEYARQLTLDAKNYSRWKPAHEDVLASLEFNEHDERFFNALTVPLEEGGMTLVGSRGKAVDSSYLLLRFINGNDAGIFAKDKLPKHEAVWSMPKAERLRHYRRWQQESCAERAQALVSTLDEFEEAYTTWTSTRGSKIAALMGSKRILACTTTAAAMYADQIALVKPGILLIEEAGEVLESHVLTALSPNTKQLIMIGDHQQLRPKVKDYDLTVERGHGFDLNCSLFERRIQAGHRHTVLLKQHRMRPEISTLVRRLTYPHLEDDKCVLSRDDVRGVQSNVVFIDHSHAEATVKQLHDGQDGTSAASHQNEFEAKMIVKIVKYMAQQGYGTDKQVVLTPYLGQLRMIMDEMKKASDLDPVLGDLDSYELVKAGLLTPAGASQTKRQLRISTIDNYQGEESDIVIASLTRSNDQGNIGFMSAEQRLNVLLSRARDGLIILGNAKTFEKSKKGGAIWTPFFQQLVENGHFFAGLPVVCQRHPAQVSVLKTPADFDVHCANGGCALPCGTMLSCGKHECPELCHQLVDHSQVRCLTTIDVICTEKHRLRRPCFEISLPCSTCVRDARLKKAREDKQDEYLRQIIDLDDQIAVQLSDIKALEDEISRAEAIKRKTKELDSATESAQQKRMLQKKQLPQIPDQSQQIEFQASPEDVRGASAAWQRQKKAFGTDNKHIDAIMGMVGLESVKLQVLSVKTKVDITLRQGSALDKVRFGALLLGNPGTGKTTVARHYAKCLASMGVVSGDKWVETSASKLLGGGVQAYQKLVDDLVNDGGGTVFLDEAYQLVGAGGAVLDRIMDDAENMIGKVVFLLAGYRKEMEQLLAHNPGLTSRFPYEFGFDDYSDEELQRILVQKVHARFDGRMKVEEGFTGLYIRIAARRVGYARGHAGFGNARAVENCLDKIHTRQTTRLAAACQLNQSPDILLLTKEDVLGPEPGLALQTSKAWHDLQAMTGLRMVKDSVKALMSSIEYNYQRELAEEPLVPFNLNRVFLGSPGTGKTTVAKLYGQILAELGLLSNGEVVVKNPADFTGDVLGASEKTTKAILAATVGKVLVIDEAYGLHSSAATGSYFTDPYKTAVIDTLVAEVHSVPGDDRCVLLLGYKDEMEKLLQHANPGLARRFPTSSAFLFEDFTDDELNEIVDIKISKLAYQASPGAKTCIMEELKRARFQLHFGNAGEVDIILNRAKEKHLQRCTRTGVSDSVLQAEDFGAGLLHKEVTIADLFKDTVGSEDMVSRLQQIKNVVTNLEKRGIDPRAQVPYNFVFCGPPGTGKTTTARKIGSIYHSLGILASTEVLEKSASDLVAGYVGQTGEKTRKLFESALGKVLLIDEAYRLASGDFAKEAVDEMVDLLTKPAFAGKMIVILAGYDRDIERLMSSNPGLDSRFPERMAFSSLTSKACASLLILRLQQQAYLDGTSLKSLSDSAAVLAAFDELIAMKHWANARDVQNLANTIARSRLQVVDGSGSDLLAIDETHVLDALQSLIKERSQRTALAPAPTLTGIGQRRHMLQTPPQSAPPPASAAGQSATKDDTDDTGEPPDQPVLSLRDAGVTEEIWTQLKIDEQKAIAAEKRYQDSCLELDRRTRKLELLDASSCLSSDETSLGADDTQDDDEQERSRMEYLRREKKEAAEAARLAREQERVQLEILRREKEAMEAERQLEMQRQKQLRAMGVCPQGFAWIKQTAGYRCAGGSHYLDNSALT